MENERERDTSLRKLHGVNRMWKKPKTYHRVIRDSIFRLSFACSRLDPWIDSSARHLAAHFFLRRVPNCAVTGGCQVQRNVVQDGTRPVPSFLVCSKYHPRAIHRRNEGSIDVCHDAANKIRCAPLSLYLPAVYFNPVPSSLDFVAIDERQGRFR